MSEYEHQLTKAIADADSEADAIEIEIVKKREPTVRFTIKEAKLLQRALEKYAFTVAGYDDTLEEVKIEKLQNRIKKFVEKFASREVS